MTESSRGSTVPRRQLGRQLHQLREQASMTARAAARAMEFSEAKLFRMEGGKTSMRSLEVERMCQLYGASDELARALVALARETKAKGWWHSYSDIINEDFAVYIGLEAAASQLDWYESDLVPGLLQTEDYARAMLTTEPLASGPADEEATRRRVQFRLSRQQVLTQPTDPLALDVVLGEAVVKRPVGGEKTLAGQLDHLLHMSELSNVQIKVMPHSIGSHAGIVSGPFVVMRFPDPGHGRPPEPPTVQVDGFLGTLYLDQPSEIELYDAAWHSIWTTALDIPSSRTFITKALKELSP